MLADDVYDTEANSMDERVREWYEEKRNVDEMKRWDSPKLKQWERLVTTCLPPADGLLSFSGHDDRFLTQNYGAFLKDRRFYPYADTELYWETFEASELRAFVENAGYAVLLCERGENYKPEDGPILHCLCRKRGGQ